MTFNSIPLAQAYVRVHESQIGSLVGVWQLCINSGIYDLLAEVTYIHMVEETERG